jgi:hypothetical protein
VLDRLGIHQAAGVENDAGAQEFQRLGDFRGLGETPHARKQRRRIEHAVASRRVFHEEFPWQPSEHTSPFMNDFPVKNRGVNMAQ